ncbi:MAG: lipopolysaccharide core heptose(I) kinase RfaP [Deltaproteobacteria bacterium]|nr:lipopolysaccharide core heptose(I) kinase RfaP [Deltaproteobacteria bacterium]
MIHVFPKDRLVIPESWKKRFQGRDVFRALCTMEGKVYREQGGRKTLRFSLHGRRYFVKLNQGIGWKEIAKNLIQCRLPVTGMQNEWRGIRRLKQLGVRTMTVVGYGKRGWNPARLQSFVITEELANTLSLENFCRDWPGSPPEAALKRTLVTEVANIARTLHEHGMNHRDLYLCHFMLDVSPSPEGMDSRLLRLYLIDLHRLQMRRRTPRRWRVKDIAALFFSSMDIGLTRSDLFRFIRSYANKSLRASLEEDRPFWQGVKRRGIRLYRKVHEKDPGITL